MTPTEHTANEEAHHGNREALEKVTAERDALLRAVRQTAYERWRQQGLWEAAKAVPIFCETCAGTGIEDNAECGDISFNTWKCRSCKGVGKTDNPEILALIDTPAPDPVGEAARVLLDAVSESDVRVVKPYYETTDNFIGRHAVDRFLRALAAGVG